MFLITTSLPGRNWDPQAGTLAHTCHPSISSGNQAQSAPPAFYSRDACLPATPLNLLRRECHALGDDGNWDPQHSIAGMLAHTCHSSISSGVSATYLVMMASSSRAHCPSPLSSSRLSASSATRALCCPSPSFSRVSFGVWSETWLGRAGVQTRNATKIHVVSGS